MKVGPVLTSENIDPLVAAGKIKSDDNLGWRDIRFTQLSIARHYGGTNVNGVHYTYIPESDELVRDDVLAMVMKRRADALKKAAPTQPDLLVPTKAARKRRPSNVRSEEGK